jgi:AcrR family transcriptional regulator
MAETRKDQLITAAEKLFAERGFAATSMRDIATELEMEAASLYSHIKSKDEILQIICFDMAEKFNTAIKEVNDIYFNAEEKLRLAIRNHVKIICENAAASKVFLDEWRNLPEPELTEFKWQRNEYEHGFHEIIETGNEEHLFNEVDKKFAVLTILGAVNSVNGWYQADGKMNPKQVADRLSDFILIGLKKRKSF